MTANTYTSPFTGDIVQPTDVSYQALDLTADTQLAWPSYVPPNSGYVPLSRIIDVTPDEADWIINLPPGGQGSVGSDVLFRNVGSDSFYVNSFDNTQSSIIEAGEARYFYLTDDSTEEGVWGNFTYGTGTSSADAGLLAGNGLSALLGKLVTSNIISQITTAPTLSEASRAITYVWTRGATTITLPAAANISSGWYILLRNNGSGTITVTPQGTSSINDSTSQAFNPGDSGFIIFDSSSGDFFTVGLSPANQTTFSSATYDVDSIVGSTFDLSGYAPSIQTYVALSGTRTTNLEIDLPAVTELYVLVNNTNQNAYTLGFKVNGSSQTAITVTAGSTALVLSDGNLLYLLSTANSSVFQAIDGSASAPSYSFISDNNTGMYLASANQLGLSANGANILLLNNSNPASPAVSTPGTFTAEDGISGGTF
jgi:hypothetical protein